MDVKRLIASYMDKYGMTEEDMAHVVMKNHKPASLNPSAHLRTKISIDEVMASHYVSGPIKLYDCCPQSCGGGAMILASQKYIRDRNLDAIWITGVRHCSDTYYLGELSRRADGKRCRRRSRAMLADLGELLGVTRDGEFQLGGRRSINPSGGVLCTNAIAATGMIRAIESALQLFGDAGWPSGQRRESRHRQRSGSDHQLFGTLALEG